ncbi:MAG: DUF2177 family protein [Bdellovibrionales bacterium]
MDFLIIYFITLIAFLAIDLVWLSLVAKRFYFSQLRHLMLEQVNLKLAAFFYLFYIIGIVVFAVQPALNSGRIIDAAIYGGLFGFLAYGTYNVTNMATLEKWPFKMSVVDMIWGTFLTIFVAVIGTVTAQIIL